MAADKTPLWLYPATLWDVNTLAFPPESSRDLKFIFILLTKLHRAEWFDRFQNTHSNKLVCSNNFLDQTKNKSSPIKWH